MMKKRIAATFLIAAVCIVGLIIYAKNKNMSSSTTLSGEGISNSYFESADKYISEQKECDFKTTTIGSYEQDNNKENGTEPIEWMILYEDNERQLLLSRYLLDSVTVSYDKTLPWQETKGYIWLNDTFYNSAFTDEERKNILLTHIDEEVSKQDSEDAEVYIQPEYDAYLFYLSEEEINNYLVESTGSRTIYKKGFIGYKTPYLQAKTPVRFDNEDEKKEFDELIAQGVLVPKEWPSRTPGTIEYEEFDGALINPKVTFAFVYNTNHKIFSDNYAYSASKGFCYRYGNWCQRPAMWVKK
jgi:hypothetical protein